MKQLITMLNKIWAAIGNMEDNMEETIDMCIISLLKEFCIKELNLQRKYRAELDDDINGAGCYIELFHKICIHSRYSFYVNGARKGNGSYLSDCINTVLHEFRHAWQFEGNMEIPKSYINFDNNPDGYWNQPIEVDARRWAKDNEAKAYKYIIDHLIDELIK